MSADAGRATRRKAASVGWHSPVAAAVDHERLTGSLVSKDVEADRSKEVAHRPGGAGRPPAADSAATGADRAGRRPIP